MYLCIYDNLCCHVDHEKDRVYAKVAHGSVGFVCQPVKHTKGSGTERSDPSCFCSKLPSFPIYKSYQHEQLSKTDTALLKSAFPGNIWGIV